MENVIMWPMTYAVYERNNQSCHIIWAESSQRLILVSGLPESWLYMDSGLARMKLEHTGWKELNKGKVK